MLLLNSIPLLCLLSEWFNELFTRNAAVRKYEHHYRIPSPRTINFIIYDQVWESQGLLSRDHVPIYTAAAYCMESRRHNARILNQPACLLAPHTHTHSRFDRPAAAVYNIDWLHELGKDSFILNFVGTSSAPTVLIRIFCVYRDGGGGGTL